MSKRTVILVLIILSAAFLRLYDLGRPAFRADTILLWSVAQRDVPAWTLLTDWFSVSGAAGQMPMPAFVMQLCLQVLSLPITPFTVRLPFAIFGILTVLVAYFAGRKFKDDTFGLVLSAVVAVSPFCVHYSREAYFYSTAILGYFLYFWAAVDIGTRLWPDPGRLTAKDTILLATALFVAAYSQITGLMICVVGGILLYGLAIYHRKDGSFKSNLIHLTLAHVVLAPLVFVPWGLPPILKQISEGSSYGTSLSGGLNPVVELTKAFLQISWGWTAVGVLILAVALALTVYGYVRHRNTQLLICLYFIIAQLILFILVRKAAGAFYEARYLAGILPFYLAVLTYGLFEVPHELAAARGSARNAALAAWLPIVLAVGFLCYPAYLVTQLTGKPTPYRDIVRWTDSHLPPQTPVLVDRWFEPWNELAAHPSTNVVFTFTVPNEPVENYIKNKWRDTARTFFSRFPDAAYLEIAKTYFDNPAVGPWDWPHHYFSQHIAITNEAGLKLRKLGLAARGDFYGPTTNRVIVELFYNTESDLVVRAHAAGMKMIALFGSGWKFEKTGPMQIFRLKTNEFLEWRLLEKNAEVRLYNLSGQPVKAMLNISAVSVGGSKRVSCAGYDHTFQNGAAEVWHVGPIDVPPGGIALILEDKLWTMSNIPLLVNGLSCQPAAAAVSASTEQKPAP